MDSMVLSGVFYLLKEEKAIAKGAIVKVTGNCCPPSISHLCSRTAKYGFFWTYSEEEPKT